MPDQARPRDNHVEFVAPAHAGAPAAGQHFDHMLLVGVDAQVAGDHQRLLDDLLGGERRMLQQRARRRLRIGTARADGDDAELGLEHIARPGDDQRRRRVGHGKHRLQPPQHAVRSPILGQFDGRPRQVALVLLELGLEALEQRERVRRGAGESRQHALVIKPAHLARARLDDDAAERDLSVAAQRHGAVAPHRKYGRSVKLFHGREISTSKRRLARAASRIKRSGLSPFDVLRRSYGPQLANGRTSPVA